MEHTRWYKDRVFYQIWPRSFKDSNGDGMVVPALDGMDQYGYPDDEYFFLKLFDMSRRGYERNPKSHKKVIEPKFEWHLIALDHIIFVKIVGCCYIWSEGLSRTCFTCGKRNLFCHFC